VCFSIVGFGLKGKVNSGGRGGFVFRVRVGDVELEICGSREEVLRTVEDLPNLVGNVEGVFEGLRSRAGAKVSVKAEANREEAVVERFPKVSKTDKCDEAVLRILESDWGKWRPRTVVELKEALRANELKFSGRVLAGVLMGLVRKKRVRRWKTDAGYVYILAESESLA
jgi:hypothetical protein